MKENDNNMALSKAYKDQSSDLIDSHAFEAKYVDKVKSLTPEHPKTGEPGTFSRFAGGYAFIRPIYVTQSGKEFLFLLPEDDYDERRLA